MQTVAREIGPVLDAIHDALDGWLGKPQWKQTEGRVTLVYRFESEEPPPVRLLGRRAAVNVPVSRNEHRFRVHGDFVFISCGNDAQMGSERSARGHPAIGTCSADWGFSSPRTREERARGSINAR